MVNVDPLLWAQSQFVWSLVLMLVTCTDPLIPADDATDAVVDAVRPGPEIFKLMAFGENVRVCD